MALSPQLVTVEALAYDPDFAFDEKVRFDVRTRDIRRAFASECHSSLGRTVEVGKLWHDPV